MTTFTTEDREQVTNKEHWEEAYNGWVKLLERANAKGLLKDSSSCFDEGWRQAAMIAIALVQSNSEASALDVATLLERKLLK